MEIDRKQFIECLGGEQSVSRMDSEARADALEDHMMVQLNQALSLLGNSPANDDPYPTVADIEAQIETRTFRQGAGFLMAPPNGEKVRKLAPMPEKPTLVDFFRLRFNRTSPHVLQSAALATRNGMSEEIILACLLHDVVQEIMRTDHGWWGAQIFEPYVPEKVSFAIRYHQALRYFPDPAVGYEYPDLLSAAFRPRLRPPSVHRRDVQDGAQAQVVHGAALGNRERSVRFRSQRCGFDRAVPRHHRAPLQTAEGRLRERRQPRGAHVADNLTSRSASLVVSGRHPPYKTPSFGTTNRRRWNPA